MAFHIHQMKGAAVGFAIGVIAGLLGGAFFGSPSIGMIIGGIIGLRIGLIPRKEAHIDIRPFDRGMLIYIVPIAAVLIIAAWFFRPWLHGPLMLFYTAPSAAIAIIALACLLLSFWYGLAWARIPLIILLSLSVLLFILNNALVQISIVGDETYHTISELPDTAHYRLVPQAIAQRYLLDSLQKSRETVGPMDIIRLNGSLAWTSPRIPDGGILYLSQPVNGLLVVDATSSGRETRMITSEMKVGEGIGISDNIYWRVFKERYLINVDEVYYIVDGDKVYTIVSVIDYHFDFPVMVPGFAGIYIIDEEGGIKWAARETLKDIPLLKDNKIYPEYLARLRVDSYKYHLGWFNTLFLHKDQIEISDVWGQGNQQPFLMDTKGGLKWVVATEPYGKSYGVFKIFLVDAFDGKIELLQLDEDLTLTGPVRVVSYVKKKFPEIDWSTAQVIEPRPYTKGGKLLWMLSITPSDFAGISYTVLVDAENNEIFAFQEDDELIEFLEGGDVNQTVKDDPGSVYLDEKTKMIIREKIEDIEDELMQLKLLLGE